MTALENTKGDIMQLMVSVAQADRLKAEVQIQEIRELIFEEMDITTDDEELVQWGKYLKIVAELEAKLNE